MPILEVFSTSPTCAHHYIKPTAIAIYNVILTVEDNQNFEQLGGHQGSKDF